MRMLKGIDTGYGFARHAAALCVHVLPMPSHQRVHATAAMSVVILAPAYM
jgi:hypothetical protein